MAISTFIATGDSLTEGLSDRYANGHYRGWADRVADELTKHEPTFSYANLAVRGKLIEEVVAEQVPKAAKLAGSENSLLSFHAGANNVLRANYNSSEVFSNYHSAVRRLTETGSKVLVFTVREIAEPKNPVEILWNKRFGEFNRNVFEVANKFSAKVMDANSQEVFGDPRMLAADRLHLSSEGHRRVAAAVLTELNYPHDQDWLDPLPALNPLPTPLRVATTALWGMVFVGPWIIRRLTGKSSGDDRIAKYPDLISWPSN